MKNEIRIVIADDHPIFRSGLRNEIEKVPGLKIVAEAEDGESALERIQTLQPDIAVLDLKMPNRNGFEVMRAIQEKEQPVAVIFLTMHKDERIFTAALDKGAKGYVLKDGAVNEIVAAIKAVAAGENFISPSLSTILIKQRRRVISLAEQTPALRHLTAAERRVLCLIAANKTSKEIADELFVAESTVNKHRENICRKLDLHGSHALLNFALEHKSELSDSSRI
jgi:DNA-binding NarL/FixJ family response regulator